MSESGASNTSDKSCVLVVGAGPVGLLTACELARRGVVVRIIDKRDEPSPWSKALAVHARTQEIFEDLDIIEVATSGGTVVDGLQLWANGRSIAEVDTRSIDSPHPHILVLPQYETEKVLADHLAAMGVVVERGVELVELNNLADEVQVRLTTETGSEEASYAWVVGCDGAHSSVRALAEIEFAGPDIDVHFGFGDIHADPVAHDAALRKDRANVMFHEDGAMLWLPLPESRRWRVIVQLDDASLADFDLARLQSIASERLGAPVVLEDAVWMTTFGVRQRLASEYRRGRVFVAGDAAHAHSPIGGQGMNTGLQDGYNLGWKLAGVVNGELKESILDSYHAERHLVGNELLKFTGRGTQITTLRNPIAQHLRNQLAHVGSRIPFLQRRIANQVGEVSIAYPESPIVGEERNSLLSAHVFSDDSSEAPSIWEHRDFSSGPDAGSRAPDAVIFDADGATTRLHTLLRGTHFTLLLFDGRAATDEGYETLAGIAVSVGARGGSRVQTHIVVPWDRAPERLADDAHVLLDTAGTLHERYGASAECLYVIRPDGYIGFRSQPAELESLMAHLDMLLSE